MRRDRAHTIRITGRIVTRIEACSVNPLIDEICRAINERKQLEFRYHSLPRVVEPMALGEVRRGEWQLRAHQVDGKSHTSHRLPDGEPRMFRLADMVDVDVLSDSFEIPAFYRHGDQGFIRIVAQL